jgi:hypothetical protein
VGAKRPVTTYHLQVYYLEICPAISIPQPEVLRLVSR